MRPPTSSRQQIKSVEFRSGFGYPHLTLFSHPWLSYTHTLTLLFSVSFLLFVYTFARYSLFEMRANYQLLKSPAVDSESSSIISLSADRRANQLTPEQRNSKRMHPKKKQINKSSGGEWCHNALKVRFVLCSFQCNVESVSTHD